MSTMATTDAAGQMVRRERADCTVAALAHAASIPYELAYAIAKDAGRKAGGRAYFEPIVALAKTRGISLRKVRLGTRTLERFLRERPEGRYIVRVRGHVLSVINGQPGDRTPRRSLVRDVWQVG